MRKRMAAGMMLLVMLLFPLGMGLVVRSGFDLMLTRERERALSEEAAIARAVTAEIGALSGEALYAAAQGLQGRYGSDTLEVILLRSGVPMAGRTLPAVDNLEALLAREGRATLLDGASRRLVIAHDINDTLTLLLVSDVSPVYALRDGLIRRAALLCLAGVLLAALLAVWISGALARPVRQLAAAAKGLASGKYDTALPTAGRDEIGDLTQAFSAMTQAVQTRENELREQAARRQELIDALAHEMRTPLTAIVGASRLLQQANLPEDKRGELLDMIAKEALRLSGMDERLLQLTRLEHEQMEKTAFSSMEMAREAVSVFDGVALEGEDEVFTAERELTILLLRNLVVNAIRAGGIDPVTVTMRRDGFVVADRGCGMTREQIARAFDPFYKADKARSRAAGGAGLGLTLCRRIAQLHGGDLSITSLPGEGTSVVYHFDTTA
ncbi:MAG: HAMP domain-containing histidine kinase [Clostridia bacterium]|nr:HAMP domain-containing histidine kinase [Clostridia bacterium]